jgi:putative NIF3 family GTP cyclohydrolase 1 type 2
VINQAELVAKLDAFFDVKAYDERQERELFPPGYDSVLQRYAVPGFWEGSWNGLMLGNGATLERVYLAVFPSQNTLDTIIAREVERGAPGAMIFCHHVGDYHESGAGFVPITEAQLEELREHHISYYVCHAPLDCHPEISTSTALANALKLKDQTRFAPYRGGLAGVYGSVATPGFHDFGKRVSDATGLPSLRYYAVRHNGRPVQNVAIVTGTGGTVEYIQEAISLGCDTFVTGEWWLFGPGEWRAQRREAMREFLLTADVNLIGTSHYASEAVVMRDQMPTWIKENIPAVEAIFIPQDDPWR